MKEIAAKNGEHGGPQTAGWIRRATWPISFNLSALETRGIHGHSGRMRVAAMPSIGILLIVGTVVGCGAHSRTHLSGADPTCRDALSAAEELRKTGDASGAAMAYVALFQERRCLTRSDALNRAGVNFENARALGRAIKVRTTLIALLEDQPSALVSSFLNGKNFESLGLYDMAAQYYLVYAKPGLSAASTCSGQPPYRVCDDPGYALLRAVQFGAGTGQLNQARSAAREIEQRFATTRPDLVSAARSWILLAAAQSVSRLAALPELGDGFIELGGRATSESQSCTAAVERSLEQIRSGKRTEARQTLEVWVPPESQCAPGYVNLAILQRVEGDSIQATNNLKRALSIESTNGQALKELGLHQYMQAKDLAALELARMTLQRALALDPESPHTHNALGLVEYARGDWASARTMFERAMALDGSLLEGPLNLGHAALSAGEPQLAIEAFERVLRLNSDSEAATLGMRAARERLPPP